MTSNVSRCLHADLLDQIFAGLSDGLHAAAQPLTILMSVFDEDAMTCLEEHPFRRAALSAAEAVIDLCSVLDRLNQIVSLMSDLPKCRGNDSATHLPATAEKRATR